MISFVLGVAAAAEPAVGGYVDLEWRGMGLAGHLSHGPGIGVGASLFDDHLRVGVAGYSRPGPINPQTFAVDADYDGSSSVNLRSDGGVTGILVAPGTDLGRWHLDAPFLVGYGGFGFYLHGEDRVTPDGRKPSAWENELFGGRDSSFGVGLDGGLRASFAAGEHVRPYVAARWSTIVGFDTIVTPAYGGPSVALGLTVGAF